MTHRARRAVCLCSILCVFGTAAVAGGVPVHIPQTKHAVAAERAKRSPAANASSLAAGNAGTDSVARKAPEATQGPRRLSVLAGHDDQAWASAHSIHAIVWRKPPKLPPH